MTKEFYVELTYKVTSVGYKGEIVLNYPSWSERMKEIKKYSLVGSADEITEASSDKFDAILGAFEFMKKYVVSVNVTRSEDGKKYKSLEELDQDGDEVCLEIGTLVFKRPKLGKK